MGKRAGKRCIHCDKTAAFGATTCYRHGAAGQLASPIVQRARMRALSLEQLREIIDDPRRAGGRRLSHSSNKRYTPEVIELHRTCAIDELLTRIERDPELQTQLVAELIEDVKRETLEELL